LPNPIFRWDVIGTYTFELRVNDGSSDSPPDIVSFTFTDESANNPPIANAGADQTITATTECDTESYVFTCEDCPAESVELDGSASDDPLDGDEVDFLWTDVSGELTLSSRYAPVTEALTPAFASTYNVAITKSWEVVLTLSDCADADTDSVNITYTCTGEYSP
jgi:chitinase